MNPTANDNPSQGHHRNISIASSRERAGSNPHPLQLDLKGIATRGRARNGSNAVEGEERSTVAASVRSASTVRSNTGSKRVRTIPPFARHDPPSPPTSPRIAPTSPTTGASGHQAGPSITSLDPSFTTSTDLLRSQSPYNGSGDIDEDDPNLPASWWTFAIPGKYRAFQGLQAAWQDHVQANEKLRAESEHYGRDYFTDKHRKASDSSTPAIWSPRRLSAIQGEDEESPDGREGSSTPSARPAKKAKFASMSLPGSRRPSSENVRNSYLSADKPFVLGPPIKTSRMSPARKFSFLPSGSLAAFPRAPSKSKSVPPMSSEIVSQSVLEEHEVPGVRPASPEHIAEPKTPERPYLKLSIPPPPFAAQPSTFAPRHHFQALSPPTPEAWDRPFELFNVRDSGGSRLADRNGSGGRNIPPPSPWSQPYQSADYGLGHDSRENGATDYSGETLVNDTETARRTGGKWKRRRKQIKGKAAQASGWSSLRRKMVKEGPEGTFRQKLAKKLMFDARSTLILRLFGCTCTIVAMVMAGLNYRFERKWDFSGLIGSSPILTLVYAPITFVHQFVATWREAFGRPIGLWGLRSKMLWICCDLLFIALWSSDLSLAISDYMSTPLLCTASSPWWTSIPQVQLPDSITHSQQKDDVCSRQGALVAFILLVTIMYTANMVLSLFRILERVRVLAKQYEKASAPQV